MNMNYCRFCRAETREERCPHCGRAGLAPVQAEDLCHLTESGYPWCEVLADVLRQRGIPFHSDSVLGAGLVSRIGVAADTRRFYVPYARLEEARELLQELFSGQADIMEE